MFLSLIRSTEPAPTVIPNLEAAMGSKKGLKHTPKQHKDQQGKTDTSVKAVF